MSNETSKWIVCIELEREPVLLCTLAFAKCLHLITDIVLLDIEIQPGTVYFWVQSNAVQSEYHASQKRLVCPLWAHNFHMALFLYEFLFRSSQHPPFYSGYYDSFYSLPH